MRKATAQHILVETRDQCEDLLAKIKAGDSFSDLAKEHSLCPAGQQGGDLGEFYPGQMVPEFDKVVFSEAVNEVHGPVQTQFGFHLINITSRTDS